ncbi:DUF6678 family protein [Rhizobium sp. S96]|uniref:DUF6678 family protein n=1 Tax=Rhizobium sp. S96 TaxID=3055140 RepID=UPI0025AAA7ED|nr:DUF6678 family protein [Rhizobium sp. S96]MDM9620688.1 hypothetical protein [Rhizobium sp. S96]
MLYIGSADAKEIAKVRRVIDERCMSSHMNDTKWRELCTAVSEELPFPPPYQAKLILSGSADPEELETAPSYYGDWARTPEAAMGIFIEWLKVAPRISVLNRKSSEPRVQDCSEALRDLLKRLKIPFIEKDGFFVIYGHSSDPEVIG